MPAATKPRKKKKNMQDVPISYYQSLERRVEKLEAAVKALKTKKPSPRDPKDDAYWRKRRGQMAKANADRNRRLARRIG